MIDSPNKSKGGYRVLQCSEFIASYKGSFVNSLENLELLLEKIGGRQAYVFPKDADKQSWWWEFASRHRVYLVNDCHDYKELLEIVKDYKPNIIHTHFEGFDVAAVKVVKSFDDAQINIVWHFRDMIHYHPNPIKHLYQYLCLYIHYNYYARKGVSAIAVSNEIMNFIKRYQHVPSFRYLNSAVMHNGIDFKRIHFEHIPNLDNHNVFTFLAFGSRNAQKRIDVLLKAAEMIACSSRIKILITDGVDTKEVVSSYFNQKIPDWCVLIPQESDVNRLFFLADCFVSTSIHETFSNAICEASVYGLPVIQSDIEGTKWNAENPSTFLFRSLDPEDLIRAMEEVMSCDKNVLAQNCIKTRHNNMEKYGMDKWCEKIMDFYTDLL